MIAEGGYRNNQFKRLNCELELKYIELDIVNYLDLFNFEIIGVT